MFLACLDPSDGPKQQFDHLWEALVVMFSNGRQGLGFLELCHARSSFAFRAELRRVCSLPGLIGFIRRHQDRHALKDLPPELLAMVIWSLFAEVVGAATGELNLSRMQLNAARELCWDAIRAGKRGLEPASAAQRFLHQRALSGDPLVVGGDIADQRPGGRDGQRCLHQRALSGDPLLLGGDIADQRPGAITRRSPRPSLE
jgi:hypothetical protein